jgi:hypothetical protein
MESDDNEHTNEESGEVRERPKSSSHFRSALFSEGLLSSRLDRRFESYPLLQLKRKTSRLSALETEQSIIAVGCRTIGSHRDTMSGERIQSAALYDRRADVGGDRNYGCA